MKTPQFVRHNENPLMKKTTDCVVRAIAKAEGKEWKDVMSGLCDIAIELCTMPNDKEAYGEYLKRNGWEKMPMPKLPFGSSRYRRMKIYEFVKENMKGRFIVNSCCHVTAVVNGSFYDTWDCGMKSVGNYWRKK